MEDRNRRNERLRQEERRQNDYLDPRDSSRTQQAEQFDDGNMRDQDSSWSPDERGDTRYFDTRSAAREWRDARSAQGQQRGRFGWPGQYKAQDLGIGDDYYDNGRGGHGSSQRRPRSEESERPHDFARDRAERGFLARAGDQVASWFGDVEAARRVEQDHRGKGPANYKRTDERILEDACDRLTEDWEVDARNIQVTVHGGEVTLDGTVSNRAAKRRAEDIVEDVSGVGHVQNNLRVQPASE